MRLLGRKDSSSRPDSAPIASGTASSAIFNIFESSGSIEEQHSALLAEAQRHECAAQTARAKAEQLAKTLEVSTPAVSSCLEACPKGAFEAPTGRKRAYLPPNLRIQAAPVDDEMRAVLRSLEGRDGRTPVSLRCTYVREAHLDSPPTHLYPQVNYVLTCTLADFELMQLNGSIPARFTLVDQRPEAPDERLRRIEKKYTVESKYNFTMQTSLSDLRTAVRCTAQTELTHTQHIGRAQESHARWFHRALLNPSSSNLTSPIWSDLMTPAPWCDRRLTQGPYRKLQSDRQGRGGSL